MARRALPFTLYQDKKSGYWYYSINPASGVHPDLCRDEKRESTGIKATKRSTGKAEALQFVQDRISRLKRERLSGRNSPTLGAYASRFYGPECPHRKRIGWDRIADRTAYNERSRLRKHLLGNPERTPPVAPDTLARKRITEISVDDLADYRRRKQQELTQSSVRKLMNAIRVVFHEARISHLIVFDPCEELTRLQDKTADRGVFTVDQLRAMFHERPGAWGTGDAWMAFRLAAVLDLRRGEVLGLRLRSLRDDELVIDKALAGTRAELGPPKWGKTRRIPLPWFLACEIEEYLRLWPAGLTDPDRPLIVGLAEEPRQATWWRKRYLAASSALSLPDTDSDGALLVPHSFRHSVQTHLIARGVSPVLAGAFLGHEVGLSRVQQGYTHVSAPEMRAVVEALEDIFGDQGPIEHTAPAWLFSGTRPVSEDTHGYHGPIEYGGPPWVWSAE